MSGIRLRFFIPSGQVGNRVRSYWHEAKTPHGQIGRKSHFRTLRTR